MATLLAAPFVLIIVEQARTEPIAAARAELRMQAVRQLWTTLPGPGDPRAAAAGSMSAAAADELRLAIAATPSDPYAHERLAWVLDLEAQVDPARAAEYRRAAFAHMRRALALQPENPLLHRSLAALALSGPEPRVELAIDAGREAAERDPSLLGSLVDRLAPFALREDQWTALAPPAPVDRVELGVELESRGLLHEARALYERAVESALPGDEPVIRWILARLLLDLRRPAEALQQADAALAKWPGDPELLLTRARALDALNAAGALDAYRAAVASAEERRGSVFAAVSPRLRAPINERLGGDTRLSVARYRRALAQRLTDERQWRAARDEWERAKADAPLDAQGEYSRGLAYEAAGDYQTAIQVFQQAVTLDPSRSAFRKRLATRLWEDEQYVQAIAEWQTIASQEPANVEARVALARAYLKTGDRGRALSEYRGVLALAPGHAEAKQSVAKLESKP